MNNIKENTPDIQDTTNPEQQKFSDRVTAIEHFLSEIEQPETALEPPYTLRILAEIINQSLPKIIYYHSKGRMETLGIKGFTIQVDKLIEYLNSHMEIPEEEPTNNR